MSQPFKKLADSFHPHSESRAKEEEMGTSSTSSKPTTSDTFLWVTLPPKGYITFTNSATSWEPSIQIHKSVGEHCPLKTHLSFLLSITLSPFFLTITEHLFCS